MNTEKPDKISYEIDRHTVDRQNPGGKPYLSKMWRVRVIKENWFFYDTQKQAEEFVRILRK